MLETTSHQGFLEVTNLLPLDLAPSLNMQLYEEHDAIPFEPKTQKLNHEEEEEEKKKNLLIALELLAQSPLETLLVVFGGVEVAAHQKNAVQV